MRPVFDSEALYLAIDKQRRQRRVRSQRAVLREAGITTPSTLTRLGQGNSLDANTLVRLLVWLGETNLAPYITYVEEES